MCYYCHKHPHPSLKTCLDQLDFYKKSYDLYKDLYEDLKKKQEKDNHSWKDDKKKDHDHHDRRDDSCPSKDACGSKGKCDCKCVEDVCTRDLRKELCDLKGKFVQLEYETGNSVFGWIIDVKCGVVKVLEVSGYGFPGPVCGDSDSAQASYNGGGGGFPNQTTTVSICKIANIRDSFFGGGFPPYGKAHA